MFITHKCSRVTRRWNNAISGNLSLGVPQGVALGPVLFAVLLDRSKKALRFCLIERHGDSVCKFGGYCNDLQLFASSKDAVDICERHNDANKSVLNRRVLNCSSPSDYYTNVMVDFIGKKKCS